MAQTYKLMLGTSGKQWEQLTVKDDGTMTMHFHGTDRSVTQEVTVITEGEWKGWLRSEKGSMFPGLESGKWQAVAAQIRNEKLEMKNEVAESETTTDNTDCTNSEPAAPVDSEPTLRGQSPCNTPSATHTGDSPREPRPRRQRKPRKQRVEHQEPSIEHQPIPADAPTRSLSDISPQPSSTLKAIGMVAAATVALFVIYETGLLIPLGLIGLATGGLLK